MATNTFTGAIDADIDNGANWSLTHKPDITEDAVVPIGLTATMSSADATALSFTVQTGATFTFAGNTNLTTVADLTFEVGSLMTGTAGKFIVGGDFDCSVTVVAPVPFLRLEITGAGAFHGTTLSNVDASFGSQVDATDNCVNAGGNTNVLFASPISSSVGFFAVAR